MQHKRRRILRLLARKGGLAAPGELYAELGLVPRTGSRTLNRLRAEGVISGTRRRVELTPAGWLASGHVRRAPQFLGHSIHPRRPSAPPPSTPPPRSRSPAAQPGKRSQQSLAELLGLSIAAGVEAFSRVRDTPHDTAPRAAAPQVSARVPTRQRVRRTDGWVVLETGQVVWRGRRA